jgi:Fe-S cluster biogenesis protein NfuA
VVNEKEFQNKLRQLGTLVGELDRMPDSGAKIAARELIQLLMEVHGTGLERMMEVVFQAGTTGEALIAKFGQDPLVRNLLLLYSLHPDDVETRVLKALDNAGPRLRKADGGVELLSIREGAVTVQLRASSHACGSTTKNLKAMVEEAIYDQAPDLVSLEILDPEAESGGFVPLQTLLKHSVPASALEVAEVGGGD